MNKPYGVCYQIKKLILHDGWWKTEHQTANRATLQIKHILKTCAERKGGKPIKAFVVDLDSTIAICDESRQVGI